MKTYLRLPFVMLLFVAGIALSLMSLTAETRLVDEDILACDVPPMKDVLKKLDVIGELVEASSSVPKGIRIYLLTTLEYERYNKTGALPNTFIDHQRASIRSRIPHFVLIMSQLNEHVSIYIRIKAYEIVMPYAVLAFPSYALILAAVALLMARAMARLEEWRPRKST